jgi:lysozyme
MAKKKYIVKSKKKSSNKTPILLLLIAGAFLLAFFVYIQYSKVHSPQVPLIAEDAPIEIDIPDGYSSFGLDVSNHQGSIPWNELLRNKALDSTIQFVYCKVTEGVGHVDRQWSYNHKTLERLNKPHGGYHFFSIKTDPLLQAEHFLNHCEISEKSLPPVLDAETEGLSDSQLIKRMKIWLNEVEKISGIRPIIYTSLHFFKTKFKDHFPNHQFWIAAYSREPDCINDSRIIHWQYTDSGKVPGFETKVDLNVSKLTFVP